MQLEILSMLPLAAVRELSRLFWPVVGVIGALGVLAWAIVRIRAWLHEDSDPAASAHEMLAHYREMQRQGDLTEEEFRSIRSRLASQIAESPAEVQGKREQARQPKPPAAGDEEETDAPE